MRAQLQLMELNIGAVSISLMFIQILRSILGMLGELHSDNAFLKIGRAQSGLCQCRSLALGVFYTVSAIEASIAQRFLGT